MEDALARLSEINTAHEEGREERNREVAMTMLSDGVDPALVSKYTGLTLEEIGTLQA